MILADTSVWIQHFRKTEPRLAALLNDGGIAIHPFVIGELALGHLSRRDQIIGALKNLPRMVVATNDEVLDFIGRHTLSGTGIGYIDAHLLAATMLTPGTTLWTFDRRLALAAGRLGQSAN